MLCGPGGSDSSFESKIPALQEAAAAGLRGPLAWCPSGQWLTSFCPVSSCCALALLSLPGCLCSCLPLSPLFVTPSERMQVNCLSIPYPTLGASLGLISPPSRPVNSTAVSWRNFRVNSVGGGVSCFLCFYMDFYPCQHRFLAGSYHSYCFLSSCFWLAIHSALFMHHLILFSENHLI